MNEEEPEQGWYERIQEAADAALDAEDVDASPIREAVIYARKGNPIHEYKVALKPPRE